MSSLPVEQGKEYRQAGMSIWWKRMAGPLATLSASFGSFVFFAVQGVILARLLGPEMRGAFAAAVLFPQALLYLGLLGAPELFAGYAARGAENNSLRRSAARYGLIAGLISFCICLLLNIAFIREDFRWVLPLASLCALSLPLQQVRLAIQAVDHGQRELSRYNQGRLLSAAAFPLVLVIAYAFRITDLNWICVMFVFSQALALLLAQRGMRDSWRGTSAVPVSRGLGEARPLMAAWFSSELLERLDMCLMLALVSDEATLGYYAAAVPIAALMIIVPNAGSLYAFNLGARSSEIPSFSRAFKFLFTGLVIQIVSAVVLAALLPFLVTMFYGQRFAPTVVFAWFLLPAGVFRGLLQAIDGYLRARGKAVVGVVTRLVGTAVLIVVATCSSGWLQRLGFEGALAIPLGLSVALAFCFVVMSAVMLLDVSSHHARLEIAKTRLP